MPTHHRPCLHLPSTPGTEIRRRRRRRRAAPRPGRIVHANGKMRGGEARATETVVVGRTE